MLYLSRAPLTFKTDKKGWRWENFSASSVSGCTSPATSHYKLLQCFGNCQCRTLEMGKKFNTSEKPVGKKLRHSKEYIPLIWDLKVKASFPVLGHVSRWILMKKVYLYLPYQTYHIEKTDLILFFDEC